MARLTAAYRGRDIVAVAHGGSIRAALAVALGIEAERALAFSIDNCSLTRLDHIAGPGADDEGQWRINAVNLHPRLRGWGDAMERRLAAILAADVVGYSRLMQAGRGRHARRAEIPSFRDF